MSEPYNSQSAWRRGLIYFAACFAIAWFIGVTQLIIAEPLLQEIQLGDTRWWLFTGLVTAHVLFAYLWFWPRGTFTAGREGHWLMTPLFGLLWGAAQGQLLIAIYLATEYLALNQILTAIIVITVYSGWAGFWQSQYWDIYVAPEHNIPEWNTRKVLVCHVPFLILSVLHYMTFRNAGLVVIWQIIALMASSWTMRFPAPWQRGAAQ